MTRHIVQFQVVPSNRQVDGQDIAPAVYALSDDGLLWLLGFSGWEALPELPQDEELPLRGPDPDVRGPKLVELDRPGEPGEDPMKGHWTRAESDRYYQAQLERERQP